ncbi:DUF1573 domain-containing protein [Telmatocola sphagniphila]|uniref:DUF1573 domain-containing protein n=1 Tax=Telmatocola sphagniphila TaxID=1123043 RepID=A0A8E6B703_9BACT|nr:DUF1573 domain-containing protein [Telmatocola sphagniphila]QVL32522.1 DUF1573 domain-containing protein [Telmatocola sphagniphila]
MLRYTLSIATVLALSYAAQAGPEDFFSEKEKDFGNVPHGSQQVHYFQIKNTSNETWVISSVGVSCGCTSASANTSTIKPGQTAVVTAVMNTRVFSGYRQVTVHVNFISPQPAYVGLLVKAVSRDDLMIFPETLNFGQVAHGTSKTVKTQVSLTTDPNWTIQSATSGSTYIKPEFKLLRRENNEVVYEISATVADNLPAGKWFSEINFSSAGSNLSKFRLPVNIEVTPSASVDTTGLKSKEEKNKDEAKITSTSNKVNLVSLAASPSQVSFGELKVGGTMEQKILVQSEKPFKITQIEKVDGVEVTGDLNQSKTIHIVTLKFTAEKSGEVASKVNIKTDAGKDQSIQIPIKAVIKD